MAEMQCRLRGARGGGGAAAATEALVVAAACWQGDKPVSTSPRFNESSRTAEIAEQSPHYAKVDHGLSF
jgi:hypothetical protein